LRPMSISNNTLVLNYEGGAGWKWKLNYAFKHISGSWQLIKAANCSYKNGSEEMTKKEYDFLNKKGKVITGKLSNTDTANQTEEYALTGLKPKTFTTFKKPWTWEIRPGEFL
jgi:retron-type reverse transcriptase